MTANLQPQSNTTNVKLSAAQIALINEIGMGRIATRDLPADKRGTLDTLIARRMVRRSKGTKTECYELGTKGWILWQEIQDEAREAINAELVEETSSADELPAKMPLAPRMDADTMPPMDVVTAPVKTEYAEGQIVRFHYWLSNVDNSVYTGRINGFKSSVTFGETALIEPIKNAYHLTPRYVPMSRIIEVVSNEADVFEPAFTSADVQRLEKAWFAAQSAPRNFDEAISEPFYSRTRNAHTAYLIAYAMYHNAPWMMPCAEDIEALRSRPNAPQTPHNGPSAVVDDVQVFSGALDQRKPEIAFAPVNATNDHPLALIQPGSVASKTDWDAQQAKRDAQHAEAKARVEALNGVYQAPVRKGIQMHSPEYLNQIFKQAAK